MRAALKAAQEAQHDAEQQQQKTQARLAKTEAQLEQTESDVKQLLADVEEERQAHTATRQQLDEAKTWFANTYLKHLVPVREFFLRKLACWGQPQRFVEVAFEFLDTPLIELQKQCVGTVPPMSDHHDGCSRAFLLGIK